MIILADSMKEVENRARSLLLEIVDNITIRRTRANPAIFYSFT